MKLWLIITLFFLAFSVSADSRGFMMGLSTGAGIAVPCVSALLITVGSKFLINTGSVLCIQ